ncbi:MucR family transcriptional regulator [Methylobacterium aerolatum]|uniref:Transcriptional regulator n=1 Tax=Methylobacterium aerolatum TaxID=418708 RepID=A0ABU0HWW7_9HYPH|nr:MucR family transcriptional regulator [Methylobacterium aerolatum]MDQ0445976.1 putative transcriptional regulator [Methylobacterium aerolatum]
MSEEFEATSPSLHLIVADLVAAYVSNNRVPSNELPALIACVRDALVKLSAPVAEAERETVAKPTAAQIRKSVQHGGIVSFLDGRSYKTLKRHLATYGLTPDTYRERFGLRDDYPMVAPAYSERRSQLAKDLGLGIRGGPAAPKAAQPASLRKRSQAA